MAIKGKPMEFASSDIVDGNNLMLFLHDGEAWKAYAAATSNTLSLTRETIDVSTKDSNYSAKKQTGVINWEITSDNLFTFGAFDDLIARMQVGAQVAVAFALVKPRNAKGGFDDGDEEPDGTAGSGKWGMAYMTSFEATAQNGEEATYSVTFEGTGELNDIAAEVVDGTLLPVVPTNEIAPPSGANANFAKPKEAEEARKAAQAEKGKQTVTV
ncbi:putative secreted protein [Bacteroidales bacterium Barb4]|nr:putative secreted protein [Bacteroidales bacterium Barb4]